MQDDFHDKASLEDQLLELGQLEHLRTHSLRAARLAHTKDNKKDEVFWLVMAARCTRERRNIQAKIGVSADEEWCPLKVAQCIRQLNYETMNGDAEEFNALEEIVDDVNSHVLKQDMSGCHACKEDRLAE